MKRPFGFQFRVSAIAIIVGLSVEASIANGEPAGAQPLNCAVLFGVPGQQGARPVTFRTSKQSASGRFSKSFSKDGIQYRFAKPMIDQFDSVEIGDYYKAQSRHTEITLAQKKIEALNEQIDALRAKSGIWEIREVTEKRMSALSFEVFALMDDMDRIRQHFLSGMEATRRSALRLVTSERLLAHREAQIKSGKIDKLNGERLSNEARLLVESNKEDFLLYFNKMFPAYVALEGMKYGAVLDVTKFFGSKLLISDALKELDRIRNAPSELIEQASRVSDMNTSIQPAPEELQVNQVALEAMGPALPSFSRDDLPIIATGHDVNEARRRAEKIEQIFSAYFKEQPVEDLIVSTVELLNAGRGGQDTVKVSDFKQLDFGDLVKLYERVGPNLRETNQQIAELKKLYKAEWWLRRKLNFLGPQMAEGLTVWVGAAPEGYRKSLQPLIRLAGMEYDNVMRRRHMGQVLKILSMRSPKDQIMALWGGSADSTHGNRGELIETFIRFQLSRDNWNNIMSELSKAAKDIDGEQKNKDWDKSVLTQFETFRTRAIDRGALPIIGPVMDPMGSVLAAGMSAGVVGLATTAAFPGFEATWSKLRELAQSYCGDSSNAKDSSFFSFCLSGSSSQGK